MEEKIENSISNESAESSTASGVSTGLEFEVVTEEGGIISADEIVDAPDAVPAVEPEEESQPEEEFTVPESFEVNPKYNTQSFIEDPIRVRTTYVPRFTEVSENYRMADDTRPREVTDAVRTASPAEPVKKKVAEPVVAEKAEELDPTAEIDEEREVEKVVVTSSAPKKDELTEESLTLFKFATEEESTDPVVKAADEIGAAVADALDSAAAAEEPEEPTVDEEPTSEPKREFVLPEFSEEDTDFVYEDGEGDYPDEEPLVSLTTEDKKPYTGEFTSPIQRDSIKDRFLDVVMSVRVRLIVSLVLLAGMLTIDFLAFFAGFKVTDHIALAGVDGAMAFVDLQLAICLTLLAIPELVRAVKYLIRGYVLPELGIFPSILILILYTVTIFSSGRAEYPLFGVLVGTQTVVAIIASYFRASSDFSSFKLISKNGIKRVLDKRLTRTLPRENMAVDGVVDEYNSTCARSFKTAFVSNFFERSAGLREDNFTVILMLVISFGIALVSSLVYFFISKFDGSGAVQTGAMIFLLSYPAFSALVHCMPLNHAEREAALDNGCFLGEESVYYCADVDVFTYDDVDIFTDEDVSIRKVHLYGKVENMGKAMKHMYALFSAIGGPLDKVFERALDRKCAAATEISIEEDGVSGIFEGERIFAGTADYMVRHGISIPAAEMGGLSFTDSTRIMYGAEHGAVYVKFSIRYSFSEEFTMLLPTLREEKIIPLVYTCDPNISPELIKVLTLGEDVMRILKRTSPCQGEKRVYRKLSSGTITLGSKSDAMNLVLLAKRYVSLESHMKTNQVIATASGAAIAMAFAFTGASIIPASALCILQFAWCVYLYFRTRLSFDTKPKEKSN